LGDDVPPPVSGSEVVLGPIEGPQSTPGSDSVAGDSEGDGDGGPGGFGAGFVGLINTSSLSAEALIEEPVASGGDSTMWTEDDEDDEDEDENEGGNEQ
jgi:hypothetical protein